MENQIFEQRKCLHCGDTFEGRSDKKFCCIQHKNAYNNNIYKEEAKVFKSVDMQLHKNRNVLKIFYNQSLGRDFIEQRPLLQLGFNSKLFTGTRNNDQTGEKLFEVYDFGFVLDEKLKIKIYYQDGGFHKF
jgi:hypothetical protein